MPPTFATEWNTATAGDRDLFQAPFRAGIQLNAYQLLPLRKALRHPRVNRLIADDVGLGKTVEAGLIVRELLLRRRIDLIVVAARAGMVPQWQHQLEAKFGLAFTIINREHVVALRRPGAFLPSRGLPWVGWRGVFWVLATATLLCACLIILAVPDASVMKEPEDWRTNIQGFFDVYATPAFWLVAPLSASVIGTAFAVHGLWAARWMADVDHNSPPAVATLLLVMGGALTLAAGLAGIVTDRLRRLGIAPITTFGVACMLFIIVQMVSLARLPVPSWLIWGTIAAFGSMTVLSYSIMGELFPTEKIGRANGALNILHLGMAFALQSGMGLVAALWQPDAAGHLPLSAYRAAFALPLLLELLAFGWFAAAPLRTRRNTRQVAFAGIDAASLPQAAECPPD